MSLILVLRIIALAFTAAGSGVGAYATYKQNEKNNEKRLEADAKAREDIYARIDKLEQETKES